MDLSAKYAMDRSYQSGRVSLNYPSLPISRQFTKVSDYHAHPGPLAPDLAEPGLEKNAVVGVRLAGHDIVLYRDSNGGVGALTDHCPHRRMKLSLGKVYNDKLQCGYHGWTFDKNGEGESPATPKLYACAKHYEVREQFDAIWLRNAGAATQFPHFDVAGHYNVCNLAHHVKAPLELTVDNFCEIEHTPTTHAFFGYPLERMHEVEVEFQPTDTSVRVINHGPRKDISLLLRMLVGIGTDYEFMDDWTTYFSPVYSVYDHWWRCPKSGKESMVRWRLYIFFVPVDDGETAIFTFAFTRSQLSRAVTAACASSSGSCAASSITRFSSTCAFSKASRTRIRAWKG